MVQCISNDLIDNKLSILKYTTTDSKMLSFDDNAFDAKIIAHSYTDIGVVVFEKPITRIGGNAFTDVETLMSIVLPKPSRSIM